MSCLSESDGVNQPVSSLVETGIPRNREHIVPEMLRDLPI